MVCNIGDMTRSPHRRLLTLTATGAKPEQPEQALVFPFFIDPGFEAEIVALPAHAGHGRDGGSERWDKADLRTIQGTYRDYLLGKVAKVFPELAVAIADR